MTKFFVRENVVSSNKPICWRGSVNNFYVDKHVNKICEHFANMQFVC